MQTKLNYTEAVALFRNIAEKHKEIAHFVEIDFQEIKEVVKTSEPAMLFTGFRESISGYQIDNNQVGKRFFFAIVKYYASKGSTPQSPHEIIDECRLIALDVVSWLRNEKMNYRLSGYDPDSVRDGESVIMRDDGFYGWELSLEISTPVNLAFDPEKWNE